MSETTENIPVKQYEFITEDLVKLALQRDKGQDSKLLSFNLKPFTKKGDNFISVLACVEVRYDKKGIDFQETYVAKINPCYPIDIFNEVIEKMFQIETDVLLIIIGGMNEQLDKLKFPHIKTPKLYARNLEKEREAFIAENLRTQGFMMHNRRKGLDLDHTLLVLKELGRFHASSLLYEETLPPKSIDEFFNFNDPRHNHHHEAFKANDMFMIQMAKIISEILNKEGPKYDKCVAWLHGNRDKLGKYFFGKQIHEKPFNVLLHGDCWTNNFLFRYDENNMPVDIRFVDFQCSRTGSPALDLNYFFYLCLDGELRVKKMPCMLSVYYQSFSEVLIRAGKIPAFSFEELILEVKNRRVFGLCAVVTFLTGIFAPNVFDSLFIKDDPESYSKMKNATVNEMNDHQSYFKDRFFAIFDEFSTGEGLTELI